MKALILIIDQSSDTRAMYADCFRHHGYAVAEAADSHEGLALSRSLRPDLIVTELSTEHEWVQAIRVIRGNGVAGETAIIACSSSIEPSWPCVPEGIDVDRALPKPTSPSTLLMAAEQLLAGRALQHAS
jgi:CheY-like chemotaxis protein